MLTLNDIRVGVADKVDQDGIDELIRNSQILAMMPFDDCVSPNGGSTLTYGYKRITTSPAAEGRAINSEYTAVESKETKYTVDLVVMGGAYKVDRVLGAAAPKNVLLQQNQKIKATSNRFHYLLINGNVDNETEFDGLAEIVNGTSTDIDGSSIDLSTMSTANALKLTEALDTAILSMSERPTVILANKKTIVKIQSAAKTLGYLTQAEGAFGKMVSGYDGIPMIDLGRYYNESLGSDTEIIPIDDASGKTDIYLATMSEVGLHGVTLDGNKAFKTNPPKFDTGESAVRQGDVEFIAAAVVKDSRSIARIKNVQVQATLTTLGAITVAAAVNKVTVTPNKPKIGNKYYYAVDASATINAPTANTALNTSTWTALPANGVIVLAANGYVRVVEADSSSLLPVATGIAGPVGA